MKYMPFQFLDSSIDRALAMDGSYNPFLVFLSVFVSSLAAFVAFKVVERMRASKSCNARNIWLVLGSFAMGSGIWSMHFVGMLAFSLPVDTSYDLTITLISMIPATLASGTALYFMRQPKIGFLRLNLGGLLMALGIGTMHYTGMAAMIMNARMYYDPSLFIVSIIVAHILATFALYINFIRKEKPVARKFLNQISSAVGMGCAVAGMHYTGMKAAFFFPLPEGTALGSSLEMVFDSTMFGFVITAITISIMTLLIIIVLTENYLAKIKAKNIFIEDSPLYQQRKELAGILIIPLIIFLAIAIIWSADRNFEKFNVHDRKFRELSSTIIHLDEVLTMSARMAASTDRLDYWEARYHKNEPVLNDAIDGLMALSPKIYTKAIELVQTEAINIKFVDVRNRSLSLIHQGQKEDALRLLTNEEYVLTKQESVENIINTTAVIHEYLDDKMNEVKQQKFLGGILALISSLALFGYGFHFFRKKYTIDKLIIDQKIVLLSRIPDENPCPILRISSEGIILYANKPAFIVLDELQCQIGGDITEEWQKHVQKSLNLNQPQRVEIRIKSKVFIFVFTPISEFNYVNVYSLDITNFKEVEAVLYKHQENLEKIIDERVDKIKKTNELLHEEVKIRKMAEEEVSQNTAKLKDAHLVTLSIMQDLKEEAAEHKQTAYNLKNSLKKIENIQLALDEHSIVAITDLKGSITYVNKKFCEISKYSREELLGQDHRIINSGHHSKEFMRDLWRTITAGKVWKGEIKNKAKDGICYWVDTSIIPLLNEEGNSSQYISIRTDITERKRTESIALSMGKIIEESKNEIYIFDAETLKFIQVNQGARGNLGYSIEEMRSLTPLDLKPEFTYQNFQQMIDPLKKGDQESIRFETVHKRKDSSLYSVEVCLQLSTFRDQRAFIAIILDISQRKQTEANLERALVKSIHLQEEAQAAARAKSDFLTNMSHEIRTPMNSILGFSDILRKTPLSSKQKSCLDAIQSGGQLLIGVIDDILDITRLESGKVKLENIDFNLENLILDVFKMIVERIKNRPFDTYVDIDADVPINVKGDPTRLRQILANLLSNAIKFTSQGSIGVIVQLKSKEEPANPEDIELLFRVKDTGIGIPNKKLGAIFETFTQADESTTRKYGGTGLGLAISRSLVELMGGKIWVESKLGQGSEFIFTLNLKKGKPTDQNGKDRMDIKAIQGKKVFIIDDNEISRAIIHKCCEQMDLKITGIADSPQSALHKIENLITKKGLVPDLILCDLIMEGMDGFELVKRIREHQEFQNVKYIAVTADLLAETSGKASEEAFDAYVTKPVSLMEMVNAVKRVMNIKEREERKDILENCEGIKVLVVEDSKPNQMLIQAYFDEIKCEGDFVNNGQEAIDKLKTNDYNLCLMDLHMPVLGGVDATRIIRKEINRDIPIIALTAAVMKEDRNEAKAAGMNDFLNKPIDLVEMAEKICQYGKNE